MTCEVDLSRDSVPMKSADSDFERKKHQWFPGQQNQGHNMSSRELLAA